MIKCTGFHRHEKGYLKGFATIHVEKWGCDINGVSYWCKGGSAWANLPAREYKNADNEIKHAPIIFFHDQSVMKAFTKSCTQAIEEFLAKQPQ